MAMSGPTEQAEIAIGIRCRCGNRIESGFEYFGHATRNDPELGLVKDVIHGFTCGDEACPARAGLEAVASAWRPVEFTWLDHAEPPGVVLP